VSIERVIAKIKVLVDSKRVTGIADVRNESNERRGMRLVIVLKREAIPQVVLNQLYKNTPLQDSFAYNVVALVDGVPRTLNVADMVGHYLDHQMEVIDRRTKFRLDKAQRRAHILEGLMIAVDNLDAVIALIRESADTATARSGLMERFELSEEQANAILEMRLRQLTALSINELREELEGLRALIAELESILADPTKRREIIRADLVEIREKFGEPRRSQMIPDEGDRVGIPLRLCQVRLGGHLPLAGPGRTGDQGRRSGRRRRRLPPPLHHRPRLSVVLHQHREGASDQDPSDPASAADLEGSPCAVGDASRAGRADRSGHRHP
jgi:DNA gyrase/topoisomerase IV subunit A